MHYRRIELPMDWPARDRVRVGVVVVVALHAVALLGLSLWMGAGSEWLLVGFG